jgi:hypothetical protein
MKQLLMMAALAGLSVAALGAPASAQTGPPQRHLVYDATVGIQNDTHDTDSSVRMDSYHDTGDTQYQGTASDQVQIAVDVYGVEPDGGLVTKVSESARTNRAAAPVTCVVYPSTNTVCADGDVHPEEYAVLRTLSPKFFDPSALDSKGHWHQGDEAAGVSIDFTMTGTSNGVAQIDADTKEKLEKNGNMVGNAKYTYDIAKTVPIKLSDYQTLHQATGKPGSYANIIFDITAQLASDTGVAKN